MSTTQALAAGLYPLLFGDVVKAVIAATALSWAWPAVRYGNADR